ncbi:UDP-glucose/GDP-mannose dehydrogenase family protein [Mycolicibacterium moriokaense]|nr:UDP-glucose/GDP-mannose dehydrogenase family protein [Mycolicibacterium moriokaense]
MRVSVFGLGYVGTVTAVCLANQGHSVIGIDVNADKVDSINRGQSPIVEPGVPEALRAALDSGSLCATEDVADAVARTDVSLVCVGTPSNPNGSLNVEQVMRATSQIGSALRSKVHYHGIAVRSTVLPGTVQRVVAVIEEFSAKTVGVDFGVAANPEFLREGTSIQDFCQPPFTIVGTDDDRMVHMLEELYRTVPAPIHRVQVKEAELLKYVSNSFHALKVTFANEIGAISKVLGVDSHTVMEIFAQDTKLNISPSYLRPGFAFGGSCLPKDVRAITHEARTLDVSTPLLNSIIPSNNIQIERVIDWIVDKKKKSIGVLGLSFKSGTDDLRESPIVKVVETLLGKGYSVAIYDPFVNLSKLHGANRSYIEREIPHISSLMRDHPEDVLDHADVVVIANKGAWNKDTPTALTRDHLILDLVRVSTRDSELSTERYEGIGW